MVLLIAPIAQKFRTRFEPHLIPAAGESHRPSR